MEDEYKIGKQSRDYVKEITSLSEKDIEKVERVCNALEKQYNAEACKEGEQKYRILFERAAKEHLPFIVYCIYMSAVGITAFININKVTDWYLIAYLIALVLIMLVPLILLIPKKKELPKEPTLATEISKEEKHE
ncbi:MAG: hypothetical protein WC755_06385 [Candidatus Woesearchaeota archaeon]|jgi:hypothetical protein